MPDQKLINCDCMEFMQTCQDDQFDFAIVDPPYGINAGKMVMGKGKDKLWDAGKDWDSAVPTDDYFVELFRISKKQIIFGGNYFNLPKTGGWLFWDKMRNKDISFGDGELAWTSFLNVVKKIECVYDGFIGADAQRIHPTQKPVKLYEKLFSLYVESGCTVIDTHGGSMSSAIAAYNLGVDITVCEKDKKYYDDAVYRFENHKRQGDFFI